MEREEIEAIWERINVLENNSLRISKQLGDLSIISLASLTRILGESRGKLKNIKAYMEPKIKTLSEKINDSQNAEEIINMIRQFVDDTSNFIKALLK